MIANSIGVVLFLEQCLNVISQHAWIGFYGYSLPAYWAFHLPDHISLYSTTFPQAVKLSALYFVGNVIPPRVITHKIVEVTFAEYPCPVISTLY